uniref:Uncharacterized protein n=1 Tax=Globisporangium ultimum (strain ATCC 200006 / CBS 805.95 / DAOM BR144) TaxID=431595 RepID=K3X3L2_GLOUD
GASRSKRSITWISLANDKSDLAQLLLLLQPITVVSQKSQAEDANQLEVLLTLYRLRVFVPNVNRSLKDYRSTRTS